MSTFIIRRLLLILPMLLGVTVLNYTIYALAPGDPISAMIPPDELRHFTPEQYQKARAALGLDQPIPVRYGLWLKEALRGNLGYSMRNGLPVADLISRGINNTIVLMGLTLVISTIGGVLLGVVSAVRPYSILDYALTAFAFSGVAMPGFFTALLLIFFFSLYLGWFPTGGIVTHGAPPSVLDWLAHMVLPVLALTHESLASLMRFTRSSMLEVLHLEYITAARAKGMPERRVVLRHALRNALLPVVTIIGLRLPGLLGGAVLVEAVFTYPGIGLLLVDATRKRDYPVLMGGVLVSAVAVLVANLATDLVYAFVDPRIRFA